MLTFLSTYVGPQIASRFVAAGLTTFERIMSSPTELIEAAAVRNPPFGANVKLSVSQMTKLHLSISQVRQSLILG